MKAQMIRVISSPSSSTTGFFTAIFDRASNAGPMLSTQALQEVDDHRLGSSPGRSRVIGDDDQHRRLDHRPQHDDPDRLRVMGRKFTSVDRCGGAGDGEAHPQFGAGLTPTLPAEDGAALAESDPT